MYIKIKNQVIEKYPYTIGELRKNNNQISFPDDINDDLLAEYGIYRVEITKIPTVGLDKNVTEGQPELVNGVWRQTWIVTDATTEEHLERVLSARSVEYPPITDYLDGLVKGDQAQMDKYIADCLAVKAKYPKPQQL